MLTQLPHLPAASAKCAHCDATLGAGLRASKPTHREAANEPHANSDRSAPADTHDGNGAAPASAARQSAVPKRAHAAVLPLGDLRTLLTDGARVRGRVDLAQFVDRHERVDLRGRNRGVAQELLHDANVSAAVEQVGSEGVAQHMR